VRSGEIHAARAVQGAHAGDWGTVGADARGPSGGERKRGKDGLSTRGHTDDAGKRAAGWLIRFAGLIRLEKKKVVDVFDFGLSRRTEKELTWENG
jgi:hypothetical protein